MWISSIKNTMRKPVFNEEISAPFLEGTKLGSYFKSVHYADEAIGQLMEELDEQGLLDNTVIVIYGDHDAKVKEEEYEYYYNLSILYPGSSERR